MFVFMGVYALGPGVCVHGCVCIRAQVFVFMDVYAPALGPGVCVHGCVCIRAQVFVFMGVYAPALGPGVCVHGCVCIRVRGLCSWMFMHQMVAQIA